jgi:hypothetical protein
MWSSSRTTLEKKILKCNHCYFLGRTNRRRRHLNFSRTPLFFLSTTQKKTRSQSIDPYWSRGMCYQVWNFLLITCLQIFCRYFNAFDQVATTGDDFCSILLWQWWIFTSSVELYHSLIYFRPNFNDFALVFN